jgi:hypothetical protein
MKMHIISIIAIGMAVTGLNQNVLASTAKHIDFSTLSSPLPSVTQDVWQQPTSPMMLAAGMDTRVERRHDAVENTGNRVDDKQDFREERRDCVGEGPDCRSDNRQDKRQDTVDRAEDRVDDRRDRRW